MYLACVEEALDFDSGIFDRVRGVADVFHAGGAHVAADGAGWGFGGIGGAEEIADGDDGVFALKHESKDGAGAHEFDNLGEEWTVGDVGVVDAEYFVVEGDELGSADSEACFFKTADDFAGVSAIEAVGFEQYE